MSTRLTIGRVLAGLALLGALAACDSADHVSGPEGGTPTPVATVAVTADASTLVAGEGTVARATLLDAAGRPLTGRAITWSSTDQTVATVTASGAIIAVGPGTASVVAASEGKQGALDVTVRPRSSLVAAVTLDATALVLTRGQSRQLVATPRDALGAPVSGVTVSWAITAGAAATISEAGVVTAVMAGGATVTARAGERTAQAVVTVLGDATYDLVFDMSGSDAGGVQQRSLRRLDLADPGADPVSDIGTAGAWDAAPSPDGSTIAFTCTTGQSTGICVANRDGSGSRLLPGFGQLTGLRADQPAWSPDGERIAFRGWAMGGDVGIFNPGDIWVMDADGTNRRKLTAATAGAESFQAPTWSPRLPDGTQRLAFVRESRGAEGYHVAHLETMRADGSDRRPITTAGSQMDADPTWSPDGGTVAFVRTGGTASGDLWLVSAGGGSERPLMSVTIEPAGAQRSPAWSPDGGSIAFASNHEVIANYHAWQIYTVRVDGSGLERRTSDRAEKGNPAWIRR
jgi:hypothetical protein